MNADKGSRSQAGVRVLRRKVRKLGLPAAAAESLEIKKALGGRSIRLSTRDDRKRFGKSEGKRRYGHFSGHSRKHLGRRELQERAAKQDEA